VFKFLFVFVIDLGIMLEQGHHFMTVILEIGDYVI
jgi:hypothetical protein